MVTLKFDTRAAYQWNRISKLFIRDLNGSKFRDKFPLAGKQKGHQIRMKRLRTTKFVAKLTQNGEKCLDKIYLKSAKL